MTRRGRRRNLQRRGRRSGAGANSRQ